MTSALVTRIHKNILFLCCNFLTYVCFPCFLQHPSLCLKCQIFMSMGERWGLKGLMLVGCRNMQDEDRKSFDVLWLWFFKEDARSDKLFTIKPRKKRKKARKELNVRKNVLSLKSHRFFKSQSENDFFLSSSSPSYKEDFFNIYDLSDICSLPLSKRAPVFISWVIIVWRKVKSNFLLWAHTLCRKFSSFCMLIWTS